ncbi:hypothetical protein [Microvirga lotononidis]|nr:hypothetical protein [Microvirga lotononidis]WQO25436.1 hypothetical protein U0023_11935 [Microvirga lotononidis]
MDDNVLLLAVDPAVISRLEALVAVQAATVIIRKARVIRTAAQHPPQFGDVVRPAGACLGLVLLLGSRPSSVIGPVMIAPVVGAAPGGAVIATTPASAPGIAAAFAAVIAASAASAVVSAAAPTAAAVVSASRAAVVVAPAAASTASAVPTPSAVIASMRQGR